MVQGWVGGLTLILLLIGVLLTAFYTVRMIYLTFHGEFRGGVDKELEDQGAPADAGHHGAVHLGESPAVMLLPMALLAVPAVIAGFLINPQWVKVFGIPKHWVTEFLVSGVEAGPMSSVVHLEIPDFNIGMAILSTITALAGMGMAALLYSRRSDAAKDPLEVVQPIYGLLFRKYFHRHSLRRPYRAEGLLRGLVAVLDWLDRVVVDGVVESVGFVLRHLAPQAVARLQTGEVQAYGGVVDYWHLDNCRRIPVVMTGFPGFADSNSISAAVGALVILALARGDRNVRAIAVVVAVADLVLSLMVFGLFGREDGAPRFQLIDQIFWFNTESLRASYLLGVDGLSAPLVALTGILGLWPYLRRGISTPGLRNTTSGCCCCKPR